MNFETGFLIKINEFPEESLLQSSPQLIQTFDFLKESCAQSPLWRRSGRGFLTIVDDSLKEHCAQSSAQREFPSGGGLGG